MTLLIAVAGLLLLFCALAVTRVRDLLALLVLLSVYSGFLVLIFALLGGVDVAFTEALVGASVSTVFFMMLLRWVEPRERSMRLAGNQALGIAVALLAGGILVYGILALPPFGDPTAYTHTRVTAQYIERSMEDMNTPNVVTAVLADYRSLDTLIETVVVFTAALVCLLVLGGRTSPAGEKP
jgi:multicomponent Na+:H+ antiporter subunit B